MNAKEFRRRARASLTGEYGYALLTVVIFSALSSIASGFSSAASIRDVVSQITRLGSGFDFRLIQANFHPGATAFSLVALLLVCPLSVGLANYFVHLADRNNPNLGQLFQPYRYFVNALVLELLIGIFVFLWSLLFVIPGIIAALRYSMAPYILAEHPEMKPSEALNLSKKMMRDNCGRLFCLGLSFFGWYLLCILTAGIGFLFLAPYLNAAEAQFFNEVSGKNIQKAQETAAAANGFAGTQPPAYAPEGHAPYQPESANQGFANQQPQAPQTYTPYTPITPEQPVQTAPYVPEQPAETPPVQPEAPEVPDVPDAPETDETRPES